jgi:hypothetical protein
MTGLPICLTDETYPPLVTFFFIQLDNCGLITGKAAIELQKPFPLEAPRQSSYHLGHSQAQLCDKNGEILRVRIVRVIGNWISVLLAREMASLLSSTSSLTYVVQISNSGEWRVLDIGLLQK